MQRELLENMYRTNELDDLLKESDYTIRRRKECLQMVESLSKASEIVSQVQWDDRWRTVNWRLHLLDTLTIFSIGSEVPLLQLILSCLIPTGNRRYSSGLFKVLVVLLELNFKPAHLMFGCCCRCSSAKDPQSACSPGLFCCPWTFLVFRSGERWIFIIISTLTANVTMILSDENEDYHYTGHWKIYGGISKYWMGMVTRNDNFLRKEKVVPGFLRNIQTSTSPIPLNRLGIWYARYLVGTRRVVAVPT